MSHANRINYNMGGTSAVTDRYANGSKRGIILTHAPGRLQYNGNVTIAQFIRAKLRPINVPPVLVYDGAGRAIAKIVVNPVTGSRHRLPLLDSPQDVRNNAVTST